MAKFDVDVQGVTYEVDAPDERTAWRWANQTHAQSAKAPPAALKAPEPADTEVAINAANKGIAGVPDALLNTPNKVMNLGRAAFGTAATAMGRSDLAPELTPDPNYASRALKAIGSIRDSAEPVNARQRIIDTMAQGATSAALNPAASGRQVLQNVVTGAVGGGAGQATTEATGSEALGQSVGMLTPMAANPIASAVGNRARDRITELAAQRGENAVRDRTFADARQAGYTFPATETNPSMLNNVLESFAGKAAIKQESALRNQRTTNRLAAEELGAPRGTALTEGNLERFRDTVAQPYRDVAALPTMPAQPRVGQLGQQLPTPPNQPPAQALHDLRLARNESTANWREYNRQGTVAAQDRARAADARANALETYLEQTAAAAGRPDLVDAMRAARTQIAKSHDIERALNVGNAEVSAPDIGRALDRGAPMTGNLELIGRTQQNARKFMGEGSGTPTPGVSHTDIYGATGLGALGAAAGGPAGAVAGGIPLLRGPMRSALLSGPYQRLTQAMTERSYRPSIPTRAAATFDSQTPQQQLIQSILLERAMAERQ
mgnify:CR=1 FL=1